MDNVRILGICAGKSEVFDSVVRELGVRQQHVLRVELDKPELARHTSRAVSQNFTNFVERGDDTGFSQRERTLARSQAPPPPPPPLGARQSTIAAVCGERLPLGNQHAGVPPGSPRPPVPLPPAQAGPKRKDGGAAAPKGMTSLKHKHKRRKRAATQ